MNLNEPSPKCVDRIAMMKYGISDIGLLYSGDMRFLA
jgi:phenylalanyl-tRNA synthetase alpha subunit